MPQKTSIRFHKEKGKFRLIIDEASSILLTEQESLALASFIARTVESEKSSRRHQTIYDGETGEIEEVLIKSGAADSFHAAERTIKETLDQYTPKIAKVGALFATIASAVNNQPPLSVKGSPRKKG